MMTNMTFRLGAGLVVVFGTLFHDQYVLKNNKENQNNILYYFILVVLAVFDDLSSF